MDLHQPTIICCQYRFHLLGVPHTPRLLSSNPPSIRSVAALQFHPLSHSLHQPVASMLRRASLVFSLAVRVSYRAVSVRSSFGARLLSYSNQNKPETKEAANEALTDAKAGKTAAEVQHHKKSTGGQPLARESGAAGAKATKDNAVSHTLTPQGALRRAYMTELSTVLTPVSCSG